VKLRSLDPFNSLLVNPNFLATDFNIKITVNGLKLAKQFPTASSWQGFIGAPWEPLGSMNMDDEIAQHVRKYSTTYVKHWNGVSRGVLDPDLRVKGTCRLCVIDGSALPYVLLTVSPFYSVKDHCLTIINSTRTNLSPCRGCCCEDKGRIHI